VGFRSGICNFKLIFLGMKIVCNKRVFKAFVSISKPIPLKVSRIIWTAPKVSYTLRWNHENNFLFILDHCWANCESGSSATWSVSVTQAATNFRKFSKSSKSVTFVTFVTTIACLKRKRKPDSSYGSHRIPETKFWKRKHDTVNPR